MFSRKRQEDVAVVFAQVCELPAAPFNQVHGEAQ
jgi:hypothetical protein